MLPIEEPVKKLIPIMKLIGISIDLKEKKLILLFLFEFCMQMNNKINRDKLVKKFSTNIFIFWYILNISS